MKFFKLTFTCISIPALCLVLLTGCQEKQQLPSKDTLPHRTVEELEKEIAFQKTLIEEFKANEAKSMGLMIELLEDLGTCQNKLISIEKDFKNLQSEHERLKKIKRITPEQNKRLIKGVEELKELQKKAATN